MREAFDFAAIAGALDLGAAPIEVEPSRREMRTRGTAELPACLDTPEFKKRAEVRAAELLASFPPAVSGDSGSKAAMDAAQECMDRGATPEQVLSAMQRPDGYNARAEPPWPDSELRALIWRAFDCRKNPIGMKAAEFEFEPISATTLELIDSIRARHSKPATAPKRGNLYWEVLRDIKLDGNARELVKRLLEQGALSVLFGDSNTGKSFFALALAMHVSLGWTWRGRKVTQGAVVYVAAEGGHGFKKRVVAFREHFGIGEQNVPFYLVPCPVNLLDPDADTLPLVELIKAVEADSGQRVAFVVVDTLARALTGGDENSSEAMGAFISNADRLRTSTEAHVMVVHHSGKDRSKGARGHSSLRAAVDTEIQIADGVATVTKSRDSERAAPMPFRLHVVTIGEDADGDPITSCVALDDAGADFAEDCSDHATIVRKVQAHLRRGVQTSARQLERDHGGVNGLFGVNSNRLRLAIQQALGSGELFEVTRGRAKYLALPPESAS